MYVIDWIISKLFHYDSLCQNQARTMWFPWKPSITLEKEFLCMRVPSHDLWQVGIHDWTDDNTDKNKSNVFWLTTVHNDNRSKNKTKQQVRKK